MPPLSQLPESHQEALRIAFRAVKSAANRHRSKLLRQANVIDVQPGYQFKDGWITFTPAIVVTVLRKDRPEDLTEKDLLPTELDGIPVDVAPATPAEQFRYLARKKKKGTRSSVLPLPPEEPYLNPAGSTEGSEEDLATRGGTTGRGYQEPADLKLSAVTGAMTLICHSSPDAGWPTLKKFLAGAQKSLTVAMYDFGAKHIFETIKDAMTGNGGQLTLNLDRRSNPDREGEMTESQVVEELTQALGEKFIYSTAAVGVLYPNAYHIKVAVRDSSSFWISSGNWQGSNQPEEDASTLDEAGQRRLLGQRNREWHVISDHAKLAKTFEAYIKFDVSEATRVGDRGANAMDLSALLPELIVPQIEDETRAAKKIRIFPPKTFKFTADKPVKIQPVLTPDNYGEHVLKLIKSATKTLYFQNQYIKITDPFPDSGTKPGLKELATALMEKADAGVDVRIILRNEGDVRTMLQALQTFGFDPSVLKLLPGCHNKGIVVDSERVLISSQNYSADGVRYNRDAGLIIFDPKVAAFYEEIFLYDWNERATQRTPEERGAMPLLPEVAAASPDHGTRAAVKTSTINWSDYYQD